MRRRGSSFLIAGAVLAMALAGCSSLPDTAAVNARADRPFVGTGVPAFGAVRAERAGGAPSPAPRPPEVDAARPGRLMVYTADLTVLVESVDAAREQLQAQAEAMGGYVQAISGPIITFKVPAPRFEEALEAIEQIGEVTSRTILGRDVTEQMRDLRIRLDNAEKVRERVVALLEMADKVEDALKVEKELQRITEEIELLKGKMQFLENSVAFSTVTVRLNSPVPDQGVDVVLPFKWLYQLGEDMMRGRAGESSLSQPLWWQRVDFDVPAGYVKYYERNYVTRAMSGDGVFLRVQRHRNTDRAQTQFWGQTVRRVLASSRAIRVSEEKMVERRGSRPAVLALWSEKQLGRERFGYVVGLVAKRRHVIVFEAWGPAAEFERDRQELTASMASIR